MQPRGCSVQSRALSPRFDVRIANRPSSCSSRRQTLGPLRGQMGFFSALNRSDASHSRETLRHHRDAPPHYTLFGLLRHRRRQLNGLRFAINRFCIVRSKATCRCPDQMRLKRGPRASGLSEANPRLLIYQCTRLQPIPVGPRAAGTRFSGISVLRNPLDMHGGYWTLSNRSASAICLRIRSSSSSAGPLGI